MFDLKKISYCVFACLIAVPIHAFAEETTTYERISDTGQNTTDIEFNYGGSSWNRLDIHSGDCGSSSQAVHFNMQNNDDQTITMTFPEDNITTAGFLSGCVNDPYTVVWTFSDNTTESVNYNAQSNADVSTMYEIVSKTVTDKYISSVAIEYDDYVIVDDIYWTYDTTPTTTTSSTTTTSTTTTSSTTTTTIPPTTTTSSTSTTTTSTTTTTTTTVPPTTTTTVPPTTTTTLSQEDVERNNNHAETGIYETNAERKQREYEEEQKAIEEERKRQEREAEERRLQAIEDEKNNNFEETGFYETNSERADREQKEYDDMLQRNFEETGIYETDDERFEREEAEYQAYLEELERIEKEKEQQIIEELEESIDLEDIPEEDLQEFVDTIQEIKEQNLEEVYVFEEEIIDLEDLEFDVIEIIIEEEEIFEEELEETNEEDLEFDTEQDRSMEMDNVLEDSEDGLGRDETGFVELSEEELIKEIEELEEIIVVDEIFIDEIPEEELEQLTEEELIEYEEAKEEAIEQYVEELETEEVIEVLEEVNDVGLNNIAEVSEDVIEVVAKVVEEVIEIAQEEDLTEEQVEVVAEVLGFEETEDVEVIAEAVKTDENVAQAVDEFVERAVENADVENYTLADATTEIAFESFVADPISVIIDVDLNNISLNNITSDMTQDQKEKAQEVIVPTLLVKIASFAFRRNF